MKKVKKHSKINFNIALFKPDIKASRVTINSLVCNQDKFNQLYDLIDSTKEFKNIISNYCLNNLISLVTNYYEFKKNYALFKSNHLNSWEKQNLFQEISGHYYETATRYLNKANYVIQKQGFLSRNNQLTKVKTKLNSLTDFISLNSNLVCVHNYVLVNYYLDYRLNFDVTAKLNSLNNYLLQYKNELALAHQIINKEINKNNEVIINSTNKDIIRLEK